MATSIRLPTAKWPALAELRSLITWPGPGGGLPVRLVKAAWKGASDGQLSATTNWPGNGLPFRPSSTARPETAPSTAATSGRARMRAAIGCAMGWLEPLPAPVTAPPGAACWTITSMPALAWANSDPRVTRRLLDRFSRRLPASAGHGGPEKACCAQLAGLTERETEVLALVARGLSNGEIAAELMVTETTIKTHVHHLLTKFGVRDRVQLVILAYDAHAADT